MLFQPTQPALLFGVDVMRHQHEFEGYDPVFAKTPRKSTNSNQPNSKSKRTQ
jgi:hypothetical protein